MPATRIVSLLPSATEILYAIGAGDLLVGVTHECDFPTAARTHPVLTASSLPQELQTHPGTTPPALPGRPALIDRHVRANLHEGSSLYLLDDELLARLAPDLIVTQELCEVCAVSYEIVATDARRLRGDPRVVSLEPSSLDDVFATIETVGELSDRATEAASVVRGLRERCAALRARVAGTPRVRTLVLEWTDPPMSGGHWTPGLVELAGGDALLANPGANSRRIGWDEIVAADPDCVICAPCGFDLAAAQSAVAELKNEPAWASLRAVRDGRAYVLDGNAYVNRPGPRLVDTAEIFAALMHDEPLGPYAPFVASA